MAGPPPTSWAAARPCSSGLVALTFDDGPSTKVTGALLDELISRTVPATFFVVGERVAAAPDLVIRASENGFVIGNHSYRHEQLTRLTASGVRSTLAATTRVLRSAGVPPSGLMRPPYGSLNDSVRSVVRDMGLTAVLWDVDPRDWADGSPETIAARVLAGLRPGGRNIVLLHDGVGRSPNTLKAVPAIVRGARSRGYCFAALGSSGTPVPPVPDARVGDAVVDEVDPGGTTTLRFRVRLDRPTSRPTSVLAQTVDGSATAGADYRSVARRVVFPAGSVSQRFAVVVRGDRVDERHERLRVKLSGTRGVRVADGTGVGTIRDDDPLPRVRLSGTTVVEPQAGSSSALVRVRLDRPSSRRVVVVLGTSPGTADEADYVPLERTLVLSPGDVAANVPVEVLADALDEPVEHFLVRVLSVRRARVAGQPARVTIEAPAAPTPPAP